MRKLVALVLAVAMLAGVTTGCQQAAPTETGQVKEVTRIVKETVVVPVTPAPPAVEPPQRYVLLIFVTGAEVWYEMYQGMKDVIEELGLNAVIEGPQGPVEWDPVAQLTIMDQIIATEPAGILISAADSEVLIPGVERAVAAGVVVQGIDLKINTDLADFCGTDFRAMGEIQATRAVELCQADIAAKGECKIGMAVPAGLEATALRKQGIDKVLSEHPEVKIVGEFDDQFVPDKTVTGAGQLLAAYPDIRVLLCLHGNCTAPLVTAVKNAGLVPNKDVYVIGNDLADATLEVILNGEADSTVGQDPYTMAMLAFVNCYMKVNQIGKHSYIPGKHSVPYIDPGTSLIFKDDIGPMREGKKVILDMYK